MKRTILALTLTLALSSAVPVRASDASFTTPVGNIWANSLTSALPVQAPISDIEVPTNGMWTNSGTISLYYAISELFVLGS